MGIHKTAVPPCDAAAQERAAKNMGLIYFMVKKFKDCTGMHYLTHEEAVGIGTVALVKAAANPQYDPAKGAWSTWACQGIWLALANATDREMRRRKGITIHNNNGEGHRDLFELTPCHRQPTVEGGEFTAWLRTTVRPTISRDMVPIFDLWVQGFDPLEIASKLGRERAKVTNYIVFLKRTIREKFRPNKDSFI